MQRDNGYTFHSRVRFSEIDHRGKMTLPGIINYFQDCSTFQSEEIGLGIEYLTEKKRAWVLSSWQVVTERYPGLMEELAISTWATDFKGVLGGRNFCMTDEQGEAVAYANSLWVYMDMEKGRPVKPEEAEIEAYGTGEPLDMEYAPRKITLPEEWEELPPFQVGRSHIDTNEHVNNCRYVLMAMEMLKEEREVYQMRAEYKRSAVYKDMILPKVAHEDERTVVKLCDVQGKPYTIVEFQWA